MPALEMYPVTSPVAESVILLTEANIPGVLVTTELQVRTRSAFLKTRLLIVNSILYARTGTDIPNNVDVVVGHFHDLPLLVA